MKILTIIGTTHIGNTRAITDLFLNEFRDENISFDEIILPKDFNDVCYGCANCITIGEDKCPHYPKISPLIKKIEEADLIIMATPVHVYSCSSALMTFMEHMAYMWLVHRPRASMYNKVGLVICTAAGAGNKRVVKLVKDNMFYWGIPNIHTYSITNMKMGGTYEESKKKDKVKKDIIKVSKKVKKNLKKKKVSLKAKFFFNIFKLSQKNGWNQIDVDYWKNNGWLDGKKPFK